MSVTPLKHLSVGDRFSLGFQSKDRVQFPVSWRLSEGISIANSSLPPVGSSLAQGLCTFWDRRRSHTWGDKGRVCEQGLAPTTDHSREKTALPTPQTPSPSFPSTCALEPSQPAGSSPEAPGDFQTQSCWPWICPDLWSHKTQGAFPSAPDCCSSAATSPCEEHFTSSLALCITLQHQGSACSIRPVFTSALSHASIPTFLEIRLIHQTHRGWFCYCSWKNLESCLHLL